MGEDTRAIEGQIEDTRERMGDTVAALSYKADVPGRMKDSVSDKKDAVTGKLSSAKDAVMGSAAPLACAGVYFAMPSFTGITATGGAATSTTTPATDSWTS